MRTIGAKGEPRKSFGSLVTRFLKILEILQGCQGVILGVPRAVASRLDDEIASRSLSYFPDFHRGCQRFFLEGDIAYVRWLKS